MELGSCSYLQSSWRPVCKGPSQQASHFKRRRRACLNRCLHCPQPHNHAFQNGDAAAGRLYSTAAAAIPASSGHSTSSARRAETTQDGPSQPSSSSPLSLQQTTQTEGHQAQLRRGRPRFKLLPEDPDDRQLPDDNPSLDDIVLDEQYYRDIGLTKEEVQEALWQLNATEVDPEGVNLGPGSPLPSTPAGAFDLRNRSQVLTSAGRDEQRGGRKLQEQTRGSVDSRVAGAAGNAQTEREEAEEMEENEEEEEEEDLDESVGQGETRLLTPFGDSPFDLGAEEDEGDAYGPEAIVLAGFRAEEHGVVRAVLDSAGGHVVKVLPVTEAMLFGTVEEAVHAAEQDWGAPRSLEGPRGGSWGAQRTVLFSGLGFLAQLTVLELLESSGLPTVCAAAAREDQAGRRLGEVLAEAVATQRSHANRFPKEEEPWRAAAAATGRVTDDQRGLAPLEDLIGQKAQERLWQVKDDGDQDKQAAYDAASRDASISGSSGAAAAAEASSTGLTEVGLKAAEAAASEWEAWRASRAAAAEAVWGLESDDRTVSDPSLAANLGPDVDAVGDLNLADFGVDLEQLREQVLWQLSDMDSETLDELLVDSPYGNAAGEALTQWRLAQEEDGGVGRPAAAAATGLTLEEVGQLAERQQQRWRNAQVSLETAVAAAGRLVVDAESSLIDESSQAALSLPRQERHTGPPVATSPGPVPTAALQSDEPAVHSGADAVNTAPVAPASASLGRAAASCTSTGPMIPPPQQQQQQSPAAQLQPRQQLTPAPPPPPTFELFGFSESSATALSELDNLLGQLAPADGSDGGLAVPTSAVPLPLSFLDSLTPAALGSGGGAQASSTPGVLQQVKEAARSGAAPEDIQRMLDERYGVKPPPSPAVGTPSESAAAAAQPQPPQQRATLAGRNDAPLVKRPGSLFAGCKAAKAASAPAPEPEDGPRTRPRRSYGPAPPPEPDPLMKPLLNLRPDIAKAVQERKVQFMDLSRLSDKQKRQFVEYQARQRLQQEAQQQELLLQQQQQQQLQQRQQQALRQQQQSKQELRKLEEGFTGAAAAAAGTGSILQGDSMNQHNDARMVQSHDIMYDTEEDSEYDAEDDEEDEDQEYGTVLDAEKLQLLMAASQQEGVSLEDTLAQAVAMGVRLPVEVLSEAGVSPPSEEALACARDEYDKMFQEWAMEEGMAMRTRGPVIGTMSGEEDDGEGRGSTAGGLPSSTPPPSQPTPTSTSSGSISATTPRPWGAGLTARRRRPSAPAAQEPR